MSYTRKVSRASNGSGAVGRKENVVFSFVSYRIRQKWQGWQNASLSKDGKCLLLKTATQTILNFWMNLMLIPAEVYTKIQRQMNGFWWGDGQDGNVYVGWSGICFVLSKKRVVWAMLEKQGWRFLNDSNPLVTSTMKARYFLNNDFLNAKLGENPSYM